MRSGAMLRPDTLALTALLALLTSLGPLSTDMYLPSLPAIGAEFGRGVPEVQLTLSAFLLGFAAGQVFYGPLADRHGRKPVLLAGLALFVAATFACALSSSLEWLTLSRFLQALGASGPIVLARSVVRDLYTLERAGRELAHMGMIMGLVPAVAPAAGGLLELAFGWRASFLVTGALGLGIVTIVLLKLPETLRTPSPEPVSPRRILATFAELAAEPGYRGYVLLACCAYGGLFAYISASSFVLQGTYGLAPFGFGLAFSLGVVGYVSGAFFAQRHVGRWGIEPTIRTGVAFLAAGGLLMLLGVLAGPGHWLEVSAPMIVYLFGLGLVLPQAMAGAMTPFPDRAGAASSLLGFTQMSLAAGIGSLVSLGGGGALPLAAAVAALGLAAVAVYLSTRTARRAALARARR
jgi:DHA1 family bicyclomycin/chloramphenicol resistance-like MFS transporter